MSLFKNIKNNLKESSNNTFKEFKDWFYTEYPNSTLQGDYDSNISTVQELKTLYNDYKSGNWYNEAIKSQGYDDTYSNSLEDYEKYLSNLLDYDNASIWVIPYPFESGDKVEYNGNKYTVNFVEYKDHLNDYGVSLLDKNGYDLEDPKYGNYIPCKEVKLISNKLKESELTPEEKEEYELDEDGIDEYGDEWIHCDWCEEITPKSECRKERNMGWLCKDCQNALYSRGEKAVYEEGLNESEDNPTREELLNKRLDKIIDKLGDPNTSDKEAKRLETERDKIVQYLDNIEKDKNNLKESESASNNIEYVTPNYTGGSIYVYTGKLSDGNYFLASDEWLDNHNKAFGIRIVNEDPDTAEDPEQDDIAWFPEWQEPRLVRDVEGKEAEELTKQILRWVIANKPDGNYQISDMKGTLDFVEGKSSSVYN